MDLIVPMNKTWVYYYSSKIKGISKEWKNAGFPRLTYELTYAENYRKVFDSVFW